MSHQLKLVTGRAHPELAQALAQELSMNLARVALNDFSDGEIDCAIEDEIAGADVYIVQPTCSPVERNLLELLLLIDAARRMEPWRITAVIPYLGYARQDRVHRAGAPLSAELVARLIESSGPHRILAVDLHAEQVEDFFHLPLIHLSPIPALIDYIKEKRLTTLMPVSPDYGRAKTVELIADALDTDFAVIQKTRPATNVSKALEVLGEVEDRDILLCDDIIDTAGTLVEAATLLKERGAGSVSAYCTHPVLSGSASEAILQSPIEKVYVTDTIPFDNTEPFVTISLRRLLTGAIKQMHDENSHSSN